MRMVELAMGRTDDGNKGNAACFNCFLKASWLKATAWCLGATDGYGCSGDSRGGKGLHGRPRWETFSYGFLQWPLVFDIMASLSMYEQLPDQSILAPQISFGAVFRPSTFALFACTASFAGLRASAYRAGLWSRWGLPPACHSESPSSRNVGHRTFFPSFQSHLTDAGQVIPATTPHRALFSRMPIVPCPAPYKNPLSQCTDSHISPHSATTTSWFGRSSFPVRTFSTFFTTSMPSTTLPKTTCFPFRNGVGTVVMKNWLPLVLGPEFCGKRQHVEQGLK